LGVKEVVLIGRACNQPFCILPDSLYFDTNSSQKKLLVMNMTRTALPYSVSASDDFLVFNPANGQIPPNEDFEIDVTLKREGLPTNIFSSNILLKANNIEGSVGVEIIQVNDKKRILKYSVGDAEFSRAKNRIIYTTDSPLSLVDYNLDNYTESLVELPYVPTCVSVSLNGKVAVVGHDARATLVDLEKHTIIKTIELPIYVADIAMADNQWAYAVPKDGAHTKVHCIDFVNDTVVVHSGRRSIYDNSRIKIHPSGKSIYLADVGISPSDIDKLDIQNGIAEYLYDSPYHGDYAVGGDLWLDESGQRIFTKFGNAFRSSEVASIDMLYSGKLELPSNSYYRGGIVWLHHVQKVNQLFVLSSSRDPFDENNLAYAFVYNASNLTLEKKIPLEKYFVPKNNGDGTFYDPVPHYIFSNSTGDKIYVLTKSDGSGLLREWALQEYDNK